MVLDSVASPHSKRNYAKALDDLFQFCASRPLTRSLLMEWRAAMESLSPSTINVRLSAVRKLVGEARRNNLIGSEEAASLTDGPAVSLVGHASTVVRSSLRLSHRLLWLRCNRSRKRESQEGVCKFREQKPASCKKCPTALLRSCNRTP
jgi:hypothetical protein